MGQDEPAQQWHGLRAAKVSGVHLLCYSFCIITNKLYALLTAYMFCLLVPSLLQKVHSLQLHHTTAW